LKRKKLVNIGKTYFNSITYPLLNKGNVPMWTHLWVTRRCNLNCGYCYVHDENYPEMNTVDMKRAIKHIKDVLGCHLIAIMGGEPLIRKDLPELISYMTDNNIYSFLTTNGTLLNEKMLYKLGEAELDFLEISIDGVGESNVSKKSGKKIVSNLKTAIDIALNIYNIELSINMTITKQNYKEFDRLVRLISGKGISITIGLYIPDMTSNKNLKDDPLAFTTSEDLIILNNLANKIIKLKKKGFFIAIVNSYYKKWVSFMENCIKLQNNRNNIKNLWKCQPGFNFLEVDCDGRIRYCSYLNKSIDSTLTIFDLDNGYYEKLKPEIQNMLKFCNFRCFADCFFQVSWIRKHPFKFSRKFFLRHISHLINEMNDIELKQRKEQAKINLRQKYQYFLNN